MPRLGGAELKGGLTDKQPNRKRRQRHVSLFDAVAGNATSEGLRPINPKTSKYRDTISHSTQSVPPENVLFRLKGRAFQGEFDPYWAHEKLTEDQKLPDSDLLKAIHSYASEFYSKTFGEAAQVDFSSLDETALLCLGMLLEEMADEVLGDTGDLALTEGEAIDSVEKRRSTERSGNAPARDMQAASAPIETMTEGGLPPSKPKSSKRRKIKHDAENV